MKEGETRMNLREMRKHFDAAGKTGSVLSIVDGSIEVKGKSKDGMYYTAEIGYIQRDIEELRDCKFTPNSGYLKDFIETAARMGVQYVVGQLSEGDGWWFEKSTVWLSRSEISSIFADISLRLGNDTVIS